MRTQKLFIGRKIKDLRLASSLTQTALAERLGISTSYLNQIENNQRPVSATVLLSLAECFNLNITEFSVNEGDRLVSDLKEALADPIFSNVDPSLQDLKLVTQNAPAVAHALLAAHQAYRKTNEQLAEIDDTFGRAGALSDPTPYEEVRDYFHYLGNYVDGLDHAAEDLARQITGNPSIHLSDLAGYIERTHDIRIIQNRKVSDSTALRIFDSKTRTLTLNPSLPYSTQLFQVAHQLALMEQPKLINSIIKEAGFRSKDAANICKMGLANYYAGALLMPYGVFAETARNLRHDIDLLSNHFGVSLEQIGHRLSTLQRPSNKGIPFFFARVDQAGNITKRHSATKLQFARSGAACPLWNAHQAFETPGRIITQLAETPDGVRYLSIATSINKRSGGYHKPVQRFAIALGCEIGYASELVYADDMDITKTQNFTPIGISCRICERVSCHQRAIPPLKRNLKIDHNVRDTIPYSFE
ncbi:MAG: helix-turn-helix domain-containing protein [Methyloligellaceae bacterium]